jgi:hypothetical protein
MTYKELEEIGFKESFNDKENGIITYKYKLNEKVSIECNFVDGQHSITEFVMDEKEHFKYGALELFPARTIEGLKVKLFHAKKLFNCK